MKFLSIVEMALGSPKYLMVASRNIIKIFALPDLKSLPRIMAFDLTLEVDNNKSINAHQQRCNPHRNPKNAILVVNKLKVLCIIFRSEDGIVVFDCDDGQQKDNHYYAYNGCLVDVEAVVVVFALSEVRQLLHQGHC